MAPGDSVTFRTHLSTRNAGADGFRIFTAIRPLPVGSLPLRWRVTADGWRFTDQLTGCRLRPCPSLVFDFDIENASDVEAYPFIHIVMRDRTGRPVSAGGCYYRDGRMAPGSTHHCHVEWLVSGLGSPLHPTEGMALDDVGAISVQVSSAEVTHKPQFAAIPHQNPPCFKRIATSDPIPISANLLPFHVWLPTVVSYGNACGGA